MAGPDEQVRVDRMVIRALVPVVQVITAPVANPVVQVADRAVRAETRARHHGVGRYWDRTV